MKEGWKDRDFVECLKKVPKQKAVKSKDYLDVGLYPIVSQESCLVSGYSNLADMLYKHDRPVVIFGDHTKNVKYVDFDFIVGADGVHIFDVKDDILPKFFYYELCSIKLRDLGYARHYKLLKEKRISFPSLSEQERIVSYLDAEFAKIDALKANIEQQLQASKDLFQSALKEMLTPQEGWEEKELGKLCNICGRIGYRGYTTKDMVNGPSEGAITLSPSNIVDGRMDYTKCQYISWFKYEESPEIMVQNGDVLIVKTGSSYGKSALVKDLPHKATINPQSVVIKDIKIDNRFFAYLIRTPKIKKEFDGFVAGTAIPTFSQANLSKVILSYPALKEQQQIADILDSLSAKVKALQENYNKALVLCNDLKQSLLKSIFE